MGVRTFTQEHKKHLLVQILLVFLQFEFTRRDLNRWKQETHCHCHCIQQSCVLFLMLRKHNTDSFFAFSLVLFLMHILDTWVEPSQFCIKMRIA